jgi:hypothetical protein
MKYLTQLKFGFIYSSKKIDSKIVKFFEDAYKINSNLFNKKYNNLKFVICNSNEEYKNESKYYYNEFGIGTVLRDGTFVVKDLSLIDCDIKYFRGVIIHEMNHVFFARKYGITKPVWIQEGLAAYTEKNCFIDIKEVIKQIEKKKISSNIIKYRYMDRDFSNVDDVRLMYAIWFQFIDFLIEQTKSSKLIIDFMDKYSKSPNLETYNKVFKDKFGSNLDHKYLEFLIWIKKKI